MDTSGQERYRSLPSGLYRNSDGIIFVFDVTNSESFNDLFVWILEANAINPECKKILIGNKIHLVNRRVISKERMEKFAERNNMECFEVSDKTGENVEQAFSTLVRLIVFDKKNIKDNKKEKIYSKYKNLKKEDNNQTKIEAKTETKTEKIKDNNINLNSKQGYKIIKINQLNKYLSV